MIVNERALYQELSRQLMLQQCIPPQSRQSAKRFSSRWNWDSPTPLAAGECAQLYIVVDKECVIFFFSRWMELGKICYIYASP
jgi:hypothetical protein